MKLSRSSALPPVIVAAIFTLMLSACGNSKTMDDASPAQDDGNSAAMESTNPAVQEGAESNEGKEMEDDGSNMPAKSSSSSSPATMQTSESAVVPKKYRDGTFAAAGSYNSPGGSEEINVSLTLKGGVITAATFQGNATNGRSIKYQELFNQGFQTAVVGKSISSLTLDVVNGSSLTPMGFMDALQKIKVQAAA